MNTLVPILVAGILTFISLTIIFTFIYVVCKSTPIYRTPSRTQSGSRTNRVDLSSITTSESASFDPSLQQISMDELIQVTNNFDPCLIVGDGNFGLVYKAKLLSNNGVTVALKKLNPHHSFHGHGLREFHAEMEILGKIKHPNIVKILGYCVSGCDRVLIYEYIEKGSLDHWLQHKYLVPNEDMIRWALSWEARVRIIKGVANGLAFMHKFETPIVHRDIKASNVLLDDEFQAHIADFGLARTIEGAHSHVSTQAAGTMGYMPPEYRDGYTAATVKADVFSFGVLMFEVASGKRPNLGVKEGGGSSEMGMLEWAKKRVLDNDHVEVIDSTIDNRDSLIRSSCNEIVEFLNVANLCTSYKPKDRPSMEVVVKMLSYL